MPVPLALALGKSLGQVLLKEWRHEALLVEDHHEQSPEVAMEVD